MGQFDHQLFLIVLLRGKRGYFFIGGGAGGSEGIDPSFFIQLRTHLLESLPLVIVDLLPSNLMLKLLSILQDEQQLSVTRYNLCALGRMMVTYSGLER